MALPEDFNKIFGSTATGGLTPIGDVNYAKGWEFVGANPPTKNDFSYLQNLSDLKSQWLYSNKLQRANPFADIKSDGAAALATALANLGLGGAAKLSAATLTVISDSSFRLTIPALLGGVEQTLILQAYRAKSTSRITMTTLTHPVAFPNAALAFWSIDITDASAYNLTSTTAVFLQAARTCYNNLTATTVDIGGDQDIFVFTLGY